MTEQLSMYAHIQLHAVCYISEILKAREGLVKDNNNNKPENRFINEKDTTGQNSSF